jgi:hypothetical protein
MKVHSVADLRPKYTDVQELGEGGSSIIFTHSMCYPRIEINFRYRIESFGDPVTYSYFADT